jgi:hypothetical protein
MDELVTWLRAQLDEDERLIAEHPDGEDGGSWIEDSGIGAGVETDYPSLAYLRIEKKRALAEVAAKRGLIGQVLNYEAKIDGEWGCCHSAEQIGQGLCPDSIARDTPAFRLLALPYAGRPGYRDEWRP